jgi:hypothetical protein
MNVGRTGSPLYRQNKHFWFFSGDFCEKVMGAKVNQNVTSALGWWGDATFAFIGWLYTAMVCDFLVSILDVELAQS